VQDPQPYKDPVETPPHAWQDLNWQ
jgi:rare lipoprotein A